MRVRAVICSLLLAALVYARQPVHARHAMVVAQEPLAADVGAAVLQSGGNAIDAAVAVGFALAVTHPSAGNIGGGGFMLARFADGRTTFIDFREKAPLAASRNMYLDANGKVTMDSQLGWRASGVPGSVRGFELAHKKYGHKSWAELLEPAIRLAADGFPVSYSLGQSLHGDATVNKLSQFPDSKRIFLGVQIGDKLVQPELAATLKRIQEHGADDFYEGETARKLAAAMQANGGLITLEDLKNYEAVERTPLRGHYRGYDIITSPPPSSGGIGILQMLGMLEGSGYEKSGAGSAASIHYVAEVMRRFYADRSEYLGDPDFVKVPIAKLLDPALYRQPREQHRSDCAPRPAARSARAIWTSPRAPRPRISTWWTPRATPSRSPTRSTAAIGSGVTAPGPRLSAQQRNGRFRRQAR